MIYEKLLMPDYVFHSYRDVTAEFLRKRDIRALFCDIDNTLVTYDDPEPTEELMKWFHSLEEGGIKVAFISNNGPERVLNFNRSLNYVCFYKARKPSGKCCALCAAQLGVTRKQCAFLGDQLLTDAAAAHNFGICAIIVPPIKDKKNLFFRVKRLIERPYMKKYRKRKSAITE